MSHTRAAHTTAPNPRHPTQCTSSSSKPGAIHTVDSDGKLTLRHNGKLHHIGIGRTLARTPILMLIQDLDIHIINAKTGEVIRELTLDPTKDYQSQNKENR